MALLAHRGVVQWKLLQLTRAWFTLQCTDAVSMAARLLERR
jgi:hypothetical protein